MQKQAILEMSDTKMTNKQKTSNKLAASVVSIILTIIGVFTLLIIAGLFIYPHYQKYQYLKECKDNGKSAEFCQQTWLELQKLD